MSKQKQISAPFVWSQSLPQWLFIGVIIATEAVLVFDARDSGILKPYVLIAGCVLILSFAFFNALRGATIRFEWTVAHTLFLAFLGASALSWFVAKSQSLFITDFSRRCAFFVIFVFAFHYSRTRESRVVAERGLWLMFIVAVIAGSLQALNMPGLEWIHIEIDRTVVSTFGNATFFSGFLALTLPFAIGKAIESKSPIIRPVLIALILWTFYLFVLTEGRTGWIGFLIGAVVFIAMYGGHARAKWMAVGALFLIAIIVWFAFPDIIQRRFGELLAGHVPTTLQTRFTFWQAAWKAFLHSPVLGNGVGNSTLFIPPFRQPDYWIIGAEDIVDHIHNEPLEILAESGIVGFLPWLLFIAAVFITMFRGVRRLVRNQGEALATPIIALALFAGCIAFLVDGFASMDMRMVGMACVWWYLLGTAVGITTSGATRLELELPSISTRLSWIAFVPAALFLYFYVPRAAAVVESRKLYVQAIEVAIRDPRGSVPFFRQSSQLDPQFNDARYNYCYNLVRAKQFVEAQKELNILLSKDPTYPKAHLLLAIAASELGDSATARLETDRDLAIASYASSYHYAAIIARRAEDTAREYRFLVTGVTNAIKADRPEFVAVDLGRLPDIVYSDSSRIREIKTLASSAGTRFEADSVIARTSAEVLRSLSK